MVELVITLGINAVIALFVGYGIVMSKYVNGYIHDTLMYQRDADGNIISILIGELIVGDLVLQICSLQ